MENRSALILFLTMIFGAIGGLLVLAAFTPARAQAAECAKYEEVKISLDNAGEVQIGAGMVSPEALLVLYASAGGETWTLLVVRADGLACVIGSGEYWTPEEMPKVPVPGQRDS